MPSETWKTVGFIFHGACLVATFCIVVYWLHLFSLNEDTSLVEYKRFYDRKTDIFPALSMCFNNPFSHTKLWQASAGLNHTSYFKYLNGDEMSPEIKSIDYKSIAMNISDYIISYWMEFQDGSTQWHEVADGTETLFVNSYNGFAGTSAGKRFYGCYKLQIPDDKQILYFSIQLRNNIFLDGKRPHYDFFTLLHYPNQLLSSLGSMRDNWAERLTNDTYVMKFKIDKIEAIHRRNKKTQPCHEDWVNYDERVLAEHIRRVGCRAPYQEISKEVRLCSSKSEMKKSRYVLRPDLNGMLQPCKTYQKVVYDYIEYGLGTTNFADANSFWIGLILRDPYLMEITQTRY